MAGLWDYLEPDKQWDKKRSFTPAEFKNISNARKDYNNTKGFESQNFHDLNVNKAKETAQTAGKYIKNINKALKFGGATTLAAEGLNAAVDAQAGKPNMLNGAADIILGGARYIVPLQEEQEKAKEMMSRGVNQIKADFNNRAEEARADNEAFIKKYGYDPHANYVDYGQGFATKDEVDAAVAGTKRGARNYELHKDVKSGKITREEQQKQMKKYDGEVLGLKAQQKTNEKAPAATTEQQQAAQSPAESWPQERARLAKEMQDSIKANPNDPSKWKVPQGWGAVRGSDGEMRYEIPDQPFDPVKAREEEMIARAQVDYDTAKSYAMSPYSSPSFRAAQLDIMEQLKRDYPGIGQQQGGGLIVANGRTGLRGGSNAIDPNVKLALQQQEQAAKNEMEATKNAIADAELLVKEDPVGQAEAKIRALELPSTYGLANPLDPYALNDRRRFYLANEVVNQGLRKDNILDYEATNVRKDLPTLKNLTNSITNNLFGTEFFDDEYMVGDNVIDQSNYSPAIRRQLDSSDAYNQYVNATKARGEQPMTYAEWQDWLRYQSMYRGF